MKEISSEDINLNISEICALASKIVYLESEANVLPMTDDPVLRRKLLGDKPSKDALKEYQVFSAKEFSFIVLNRLNLFYLAKVYPKLTAWMGQMQDYNGENSQLSDRYKKENPYFRKEHGWYLGFLKTITILTREQKFFTEERLQEFYNKLSRLILIEDTDGFRQKVRNLLNKLVASDSNRPIHDFFIDLNLPEYGRKWYRQGWYDFLIRSESSKALKYLARADEIEAYLGNIESENIEKLNQNSRVYKERRAALYVIDRRELCLPQKELEIFESQSSQERIGLDEIKKRIKRAEIYRPLLKSDGETPRKVPSNLEEAIKTLGIIGYAKSNKKIEQAGVLPQGVTRQDLEDYTRYCTLQGIDSKSYDLGLSILLGNEITYQGKKVKLKTKTNIPDVVVDGKSIVDRYANPELAKYHLKLLSPQDWRMILMGEFTNCCQSVGNDAEKCVIESMTNENCGVVAVFKGDKIVGQSFVWLGEDDKDKQKTFAFDSWERLNQNLDFLCEPFYNEAAAVLRSQGIKRITLGKGGKTPQTNFLDTQNPVQYIGGNAPYDDSENQYEILNVALNITFEDNVNRFLAANYLSRLQNAVGARDEAKFKAIWDVISGKTRVLESFLLGKAIRSLLSEKEISEDMLIVIFTHLKDASDSVLKNIFTGDASFNPLYRIIENEYREALVVILENLKTRPDDILVKAFGKNTYFSPILNAALVEWNGSADLILDFLKQSSEEVVKAAFAENYNNDNPLIIAIRKDYSWHKKRSGFVNSALKKVIEVLQEIKEETLKVILSPQKSHTALRVAVDDDKYSSTEELLEFLKGKSDELIIKQFAQDEFGNNPLHIALIKGSSKKTKAILNFLKDQSQGVQDAVFIANQDGKKPFDIAINRGAKFVERFFENGICPTLNTLFVNSVSKDVRWLLFKGFVKYHASSAFAVACVVIEGASIAYSGDISKSYENQEQDIGRG